MQAIQHTWWKKSVHKLVLVVKLFQIFLPSKKHFPSISPSGNIHHLNEERQWCPWRTSMCMMDWSPWWPCGISEQRRFAGSVSCSHLPKVQISLGGRDSAENMLQPLFTYLCLPASSSDLSERKWGQPHVSIPPSPSDGNVPRVNISLCIAMNF